MKSSVMVLYAGALLVCVLALSQIELSLFAPSLAAAGPGSQTPKQSRLMLATNDTSVNAQLRQRLADLGQFLTQNSAATAEALETAEKRAQLLEAELERANKEHSGRLVLLEQRLATYVKAAATTSLGDSSSTVVANNQNAVAATQAPPGRQKADATQSTQKTTTALPPPAATKEPAVVEVAKAVALPKKARTREEITAEKKKKQEEEKAAAVAKLQEEVDADVAAFDRRGGADLTKRLRMLHVPSGARIPVANNDAFSSPRFEGGLRDIYLDKKARIGVCTIEKVASSELKKLLYRMQGDPKWRDEPWFKGGLDKVRFWKTASSVEDMINDPSWAKAVLLRHPFDRLVSCYKDKFGRDNKLYSVRMTGNKTLDRVLTFEEFLHIIAKPGSDQQNTHWRPQSSFCGMKKYLSKFTFVGNFDKLEEHAKVFLQGTDLWDSFGAHGWGATNSSMFQRNEAAHRTSAGGVASGKIRIQTTKAKQKYDDLLPPGSKLRRLAFQYYKADFEMFANINIPPFDNFRYKEELLTEGG